MKEMIDRKGIERVAALVAELKNIVGSGYDEFVGILGVDISYIEGFMPTVQVDAEMLDKLFKDIKRKGDRRYSIVNGVKFHSITDDIK